MFDHKGELPLLPLWSNGPLLHGGNPIGPSTLLWMVSLSNHFVPAASREVTNNLSVYCCPIDAYAYLIPIRSRGRNNVMSGT